MTYEGRVHPASVGYEDIPTTACHRNARLNEHERGSAEDAKANSLIMKFQCGPAVEVRKILTREMIPAL